MTDWIKLILGILLILAGIVFGCYVGIYLMLFKGIVQIVQSVTPEVIAWGIAKGILKIIFAGTLGVLSAFLLILPGVGLIKTIK